MAGKISEQTNMNGVASIDRAADFIEITDSSGPTTYKATPNFILGFTGGSPVSTTDTQTLTNKIFTSPTINTPTITVNDDSLTIQDNLDTTKKAQFQLSGITTGTTRTYTLPNVNDTLVSLTASQTLTNKILTAPTITNPTLTVDAINEFTAANGVTIAGLNIKNSKLNTNNSVVTANYTNASVTADKLATGAATSTVATSETTTSTTYVGLATAQAVTVTIGANGLAFVTIACTAGHSNADLPTHMSFAMSGANTLASADGNAVIQRLSTATAQGRAGIGVLLTGLTPGSTTFTAQFRVTANTGTFLNRNITVLPL